MNRVEERRRANELKAVEVRELIKDSYPAVLPHITAQQIDQLQRVLDVEVINADVDKKWHELDRQTIKGWNQHNQPVRDPRNPVIARRDQVLKQKIAVKPGENVIRLDLHKLLASDALKPTSDNPDEAGYLFVIAEVYEHRGVWLRLSEDMSAMAVNLHPEPSDPKRWRLQLLLGYRPDAPIEPIKTDTGRLDRKALLSVSRLAAGYWEWVHQGPTLRALKNALDRVQYQIVTGRNEHYWWSAHRDEFLITSRVSDTFGGADWPSEAIWSQPHDIHTQALQLINEGKLGQASKFALLAAYHAEWCARAVHEYIDATTRGASRVVKILEVAKTCGEIAEGILAVLAVGQGVIRLLSTKGTASAAGAGAQRQLAGGQRQLPAAGQTTPTPVPKTPGGTLQGSGVGNARAPVGAPPPGPGAVQQPPGTLITDTGKDLGNAIDYALQKAGLPPRPERTHLMSLALAERSQFKKAHKEYMDWLLKNPNASLAEKIAKHDRDIVARFGHPN